MSMHAKSAPKALNAKTVELANKIKLSRGVLSVENVKALIDDYKRLGDAEFYAELSQLLQAKQAIAKTSKEPSLVKLEEVNNHAALTTKLFIDLVVQKAAEQGAKLPKLLAKDKSLPKLLAHFRAHSYEQELFRFGQQVANEHTRTH